MLEECMILQNIILPDSVCEEPKLYYQADEILECKDAVVRIPARQKVSFFSYMNIFDVNAWKKYTRLEKVAFQLSAKGCGTIFLKVKDTNCDEIITSFQITDCDWTDYSYEICLDQVRGCCYFEIQAESEVWIKDACFTVADVSEKSCNVKLALNICTYHRNAEIKRNLELLRSSRFFQPQDELYEKLQIMIVDNGSELAKIEEPYVRLVHNPNTGGSGGFKRGLEEIRTWQKDTTHMVFMDDDIEFQLESLYRLYVLLSYMKPEYAHESVAGRMFRTDNRKVQYTAAEIWNKGDLLHIGLNADMTLLENVLCANQNENAEYGGWWFCCYPMDFAKDNDPLPFFIHCDDVEYGLRHGGRPIILNGIQVWHETYEYRQSPVIAYYDMRNPLIVNELYDFNLDREKVLSNWKNRISQAHANNDLLTEFMMIKGMWDYLKGMKWLEKSNHTRNHKKLCNTKENKFVNALLWRVTEFIYKKLN